MAIFCHEAAHVTTEWKENINFRSYSPVNVRRCGNIYYIFGHVQKLMFVLANFLVIFTHFGHLDSIK